MGEVSDAFPARTIGSSTIARGTRLIERLGFNTLQGCIVRVENGERGRGREHVDSGNESKEEDSWSRAQ